MWYEGDVPKDTVTVGRSVNRRDTGSCISPGRIGNIDTDPLVWIAAWFCLADNDLVYFAILAEILWTTECLQELVLVAYRRVQANHIDKILLNDPDPSQVLPTGRLDFALFGLLLLRGGGLSMFQREIRFEPARVSELRAQYIKDNTYSSASGTLYCMVLSS